MSYKVAVAQFIQLFNVNYNATAEAVPIQRAIYNVLRCKPKLMEQIMLLLVSNERTWQFVENKNVFIYLFILKFFWQ